MQKPDDTAWKSADLVARFLSGVRGAVPFAREQIDLMLQIIAVGQPTIPRVLDLGCGDGILGRSILATFPEASCVFADFSVPMLDACREKLGDQANRAIIAEIDYGKADWPQQISAQGPFQAIVSGYSIHHQPDDNKRHIYAQILKLLAPGGWFLNMEHVAPGTAVTTELFNDGFVERIAAQAQARGESPDRAEIRRTFIERADKEANILTPVEAQCQWLRELGYRDVDCFFKIHELALFGGRQASGSSFPDEPVVRYRQSAAIPYRIKNGTLQVMVITSSKRKRWLVPKGLVEEDMTRWDSAAKEAWEEAGVRGQVSPDCLGTYRVRKWGGICEVDVYALNVTEQLKTWPEDRFRLRRWLALPKAARLVQPKSLSKILLKAAPLLQPPS